ncbi:hypothetical protein C3B79_2077 [Aeromonas hydrophila]|nr:hypothetical protein C3B79_2077 [Aeromonas hydrophila]
MAGGQHRQLQPLKRKGLDQLGGPGRQPVILPGHAHPPGELAIPVQRDHPHQRRLALPRRQGQRPAPAQPERRLAPATGQPVASSLRRVGMGYVEGVAGERRIAAIAHHVGLIARQQGTQLQGRPRLRGGLDQHRHRQTAGQQAVERGAQIVLRRQRQIGALWPQRQQPFLPGQGQQGGRAADEDLAARIPRGLGRQVTIQPGGQQRAGRTHAIGRTTGPESAGVARQTLIGLALQQQPAAALPLPGLQHRRPVGLPQGPLDQQLHQPA